MRCRWPMLFDDNHHYSPSWSDSQILITWTMELGSGFELLCYFLFLQTWARSFLVPSFPSYYIIDIKLFPTHVCCGN